MPTANVYYRDEKDHETLKPLLRDLKACLADKLTCGELKLGEKDMSVRFLPVDGDGMLGNVEIEITAHEFPERVKNQDKICYETKNYVEGKAPSVGEVRVWLKLVQLGHDTV